MRAALFGPLEPDAAAMGALAETALVAQYLHAPVFRELCFARWNKGEVDLVRVDPATQRPTWGLEVKWSDTAHQSGNAWNKLTAFATRTGLSTVFMTSRTVSTSQDVGGIRRVVRPLSMLCYEVGRLAASQELLRDRDGLPIEPG